MDLLIETELRQPWAVLSVKGEVDLYTAPQLRERVIGTVEQGHPRIVLDLQEVEFIDSTGLGVVVASLKRTREHDGSLALVCTRPNILRLLTITGLDAIIPVFETVEQVVAS